MLRSLDPEPGIVPRNSAVLVPLVVTQTSLSVLFTIRQSNLNHHGGEISFPGGAIEPTDVDLVQTALREAEEEIGLFPGAVELVGHLTPLYIPPSHNLVHPIVGWIPARPNLSPNPAEVAQIMEVPLETLLDPETIQKQEWIREGKNMLVPCYQVNGQCIWGATAMILSELLELLHITSEGV